MEESGARGIMIRVRLRLGLGLRLRLRLRVKLRRRTTCRVSARRERYYNQR